MLPKKAIAILTDLINQAELLMSESFASPKRSEWTDTARGALEEAFGAHSTILRNFGRAQSIVFSQGENAEELRRKDNSVLEPMVAVLRSGVQQLSWRIEEAASASRHQAGRHETKQELVGHMMKPSAELGSYGVTALGILREAAKAVPAVKFALGLAGILAAVAIITAVFRLDLLVAAFSAAVMFVLMTGLVIFARVASASSKTFVTHVAVFSWFSLLLIMATAALLFASVFWGYPVDLKQFISPKHDGVKQQQVQSIAVLPFVNESKDATGDYITDGITEAVIGNLSEISSLKIMSWDSVKSKGPETDIPTVGRDLRVQAVLTGRMARQGSDFRISVELVNVNDRSEIWGRQFKHRISDLSGIPEEVSIGLLNKLRISPDSRAYARLDKQPTENQEAYQLYLQGRYYWNQRTPPSLKKSIEEFQQAVEKDPNFALAYAALADAYNLSTIFGISTPRESAPEAKAAAMKALVLDPQLAEAHTALGVEKSHYEFDFPGAEREFMKAIELKPNYANAHFFYSAAYLDQMCRHQESLSEMKKALALDPFSLPINSYLGRTYLYAGDFEKSYQQFQHTIEMAPTFPIVHFFFGDALVLMGKYEEAIREEQKGWLLSGQSVEQVGALSEALLRAWKKDGEKGFWREDLKFILKKREQASISGYFPAAEVAIAYAKLGDNDKAFEWLEKSYQNREGQEISGIRCSPDFKNLQGDPRFVGLLRRMGLPE